MSKCKTDAGVRRYLPAALTALLAGCGTGVNPDDRQATAGASDEAAASPSPTATDAAIETGRQIFRFDTFGDETQWTDALRMHEVIRKSVDPKTALSVGLKVDAEALPAAIVNGIQDGSISLTSAETTVALLKLDAVVGLDGHVEAIDGKDTLTRVGVTCALCHSTVDDSLPCLRH